MSTKIKPQNTWYTILDKYVIAYMIHHCTNMILETIFHSVLSPGELLKYDLGRDVPLRLEK